MPPVFGQKTAKKVIEEVESNLASLTKLELIKNASFCMKCAENTVALSAALAKNTVLKAVVLRECEINDAGVEAIAAALEHNEAIEELDLQQNNITTSGVIALAKSLEKNRGVRTLNLLGQTQKVIGDDAVEALIAMFEHNTTLVKIILKVTCRRFWEVSKLITRNVSIQKAKASGTDASHLMPRAKPEEVAAKPAVAPPAKAEDADDSSTRASAVLPSDASAATSGVSSPAPAASGEGSPDSEVM